jgi:hypothetical protein
MAATEWRGRFFERRSVPLTPQMLEVDSTVFLRAAISTALSLIGIGLVAGQAARLLR